MNEVLRAARGNRSQKEMAKALNVSQQQWSSWERGRLKFPPEKIFELASILKIPSWVLFLRLYNNGTE